MHTTRQRDARRDGTVLIVAMWVVLVLAGLVLVFGRAMRVEAITSANYVASQQAEAIARGGLTFALAKIAEDPSAATEVSCEAIAVGAGRFWILKSAAEEEDAVSFGITDEAGRINLNSASQDMLLKMPGMTAELAAAILDWRDGNSDVSPSGAEREYYLLLDDPYDCKNGPFETVNELMLVRGASLDILAGEDANRNGMLDDNENDAADSEPDDNRDGHLDRGLYDYVTVYSREPNTDASGQERVNVNSPSTRGVADVLRGVVPESRYYQTLDRVRAKRPFSSTIDFYFDVQLTMEEFKKVADKLTTSSRDTLEGLINVHTAPRHVLLCLPQLDESDVDALIARRAAEGTDRSSIAWVAEALPQEKAVAIGGTITHRSFQFSADIVALSGDGRGWRRYRAVIDARQGTPRVVFWQDLSHLGWPLDPKILETVRAGGSPDAVGLTGTAGAR